MTAGSILSAAAGPEPAGWPAKGSVPGSTGGPVGGPVGGTTGGWLPPPEPVTCTTAWPRRVPTRASTIAAPEATPVTVPLLSTLATFTLLEVQIGRTVGMTLPTRSNAVARRPRRSPTLMVTEGGATWTSATFWASAAPGRTTSRAAGAARRHRAVLAART